MAIFYAIGNALVGTDEMRNKVAEGRWRKFRQELAQGNRGAKLEFTSGIARRKDVEPIGFEPIGIGKPLTVQLRHIYTGTKSKGLWRRKDMLVASAMKSVASYDAAPRAVNYLVEKAKNKANFRAVAATDKGTPLICYAPSLAQASSVVTVEVMFASFPKETFTALSQAFSAAAGIPVFAPASGYLVAAGIVTKLLGTVGKSLWDATPALKRTEEITFVTPGSTEAVARFALLISDTVETAVLKNYQVNKQGALVRVDNETKLYDGEYPYVVISLDGHGDPTGELKKFSPTAAAAAQLDKFYNISDGTSQAVGSLAEALKLFNDVKFREKALELTEQLEDLDKASTEYKNLELQLKACVANINTKELRP
jgi:hypothetical protein